jgi:iron complex outermembrane recepter protein
MRVRKNKCGLAMIAILVFSGLLFLQHQNVSAEQANLQVVQETKDKKSESEEQVTNAMGERVISLSSIVVSEKEEKFGVHEIGESDIDVYGGAAQLNPYSTISTLPGVDIRNGDGYGMSITHKIRGKSNRNIGETLEGLPLKGIGPGGGLSSMMDLENLEFITVEKGAVDVDSGLGYGSDDGMVNMYIHQPKETVGILAKQVFGSYDFTRTFLRVDTGNIANTAKAFLSASYTDAEKWKGAGNSPDGRKNAAFGLASPEDHEVQWSINGVYNKEKKHYYRSLTYEQSLDLSANYKLDYNTELTGNPAEDSNYYDYNRSDFSTYTLIGNLKVPVFGYGSVSFKPYFLRDKGYSYSGSGTKVTDWLVEHDTYGGILEYERQIGLADIKVGYWYGEDEPPGPPTSRKTRTIINSDGSLTFAGWERLLKATDNSHFNSPFIGSTFQFDRFSVNAGVRYMWWTTPSLTSYDTTGIGDVSYKAALAQATTESFHVNGDTYGIFLPKVGATYQISDTVSMNAMYGRNYNTPQYSLGSALVSYFKKGKTEEELQYMWNELIQPEESDNFDLGMQLAFGKFSVESTLFYSLSKNTSGTFYDEELGEAYSQNAGQAQSYGVEMLFGYSFLEGLRANLSLTYNKYEFTDDFLAADGKTTIYAEGNQIPETPLFMANMSIDWNIGEFTIRPTIRYLGETYADVENKYEMDDYFLADLDISWKIVQSENYNIILKLSATNLLGEKYIATSSAGDQTTEISGLSFTAGAPKTVFVSLQFEI